MTTRNIVPRINGEGQLGRINKRWNKVYANEVNGVSVSASGDMSAAGDVTANGNILVGGSLEAAGNISCTGIISSVGGELATVSSVNAKVSGSPAGVYPTVEALTNAVTSPEGKERIYLVTADGKWYYWSTDTWAAGGVYQATTLADGSVTYPKIGFNALTGSRTSNLFNKETATPGRYVEYTSGGIGTNADYTASDYIPVVAGQRIYLSPGNQQFAYYNSSKVYVSGVAVGGVGTPYPTVHTVPDGCSYVRFSITNAKVSSFTVSSTFLGSYVPYLAPGLGEDILKLERTNNLFNKKTATPGRYVSHTSGAINAHADYTASDYIHVANLTEITMTRGHQQFAYYDADFVYISGVEIYGVPQTSVTYQVPETAVFMRVSMLTSFADSLSIESGPAAVEGTPFYMIPAEQSEYMGLKNVSHRRVITVKPSGGDFTTVVGAVLSISGSDKFNPVTIEIYPGTYNLRTECDTFFVPGTSGYDKGLTLPDYVDLVGKGNKSEIILKGEMDTSISIDKRILFSTLNVEENNILRNLTVTAKNIRYCVHADSSNSKRNFNMLIENCDFITHTADAGGQASGQSWGEGSSSGSTVIFRDCLFRTGDPTHSFYTHTWQNYTDQCKRLFENCRFESPHTHSVWFASLGSGIPEIVEMNGCKIQKGIYVSNYSQYTQGNDYIFLGHGNTPVPVTVALTSGVTGFSFAFSDQFRTEQNKTASTITQGTPVKYAVDGSITPMVSGDTSVVFVGVTAHDIEAGGNGYVQYAGCVNLTQLSIPHSVGDMIEVVEGALVVGSTYPIGAVKVAGSMLLI